MFDTIHDNDKRNARKHDKMWRRAKAGRVNPKCKWFKNQRLTHAERAHAIANHR